MKRNFILFCSLFIIASNLCTAAKAQAVASNDSLALVDFYNSTNGSHWHNHKNWLTGNSVSTWYGVSVNGNRINSIILYYNNLNGSIPSSFGNLTSLSTLELNGNKLSGNIPSSFGNLTNLTSVLLSDNQLSGVIPAEIGNLVKLTLLALFNNKFSGAIPAEIGNLVNLTSLNLSNNRLNGAIPSTIGKLVNLTYLALYTNQLSGTIPATLGSLASLGVLDVSNNLLNGAIPDEIGKLAKIGYLALSNNQLSGTIPAGISNLANLGTLGLGSNRLSGTIPAFFSQLANLYSLDLSNNQLRGNIPADLGYVNLNYLYLNNNQLSGGIPASFRNLKNLSFIDISSNQLSQYGNAYFPISANKNINGNVNNNLFTFDGVEFIAGKYPNIIYTPQADIRIHQHGNTLSVSAGGTLSNNTYNWHLEGTGNSSVIKADSTFTPAQSGKYYVTVTNKLVTKLVLYSDTIDFTLTPMMQSNNAIIAKAIQSVTVTKHMQVFPNPAKDIIHIQTNGTAIIILTNSDGKVTLIKSINNNGDINISSFANGTYSIQNKTTGEVQKIIVVH